MSEDKISRKFKFRKTKDNREIGGTEQEYQVPLFDWDKFKNLPNSELFVRNAYYSLVQKLVRDILLGEINGTSENNIQSMESVIARSFNFKKNDIEQWCKSRDWANSTLQNQDKNIPILIQELPKYAISDHVIQDIKVRTRLAEIIAEIADRKTDDIAEFLWVKLTQKIENESDLLSLL